MGTLDHYAHRPAIHSARFLGSEHKKAGTLKESRRKTGERLTDAIERTWGEGASIPNDVEYVVDIWIQAEREAWGKAVAGPRWWEEGFETLAEWNLIPLAELTTWFVHMGQEIGNNPEASWAQRWEERGEEQDGLPCFYGPDREAQAIDVYDEKGNRVALVFGIEQQDMARDIAYLYHVAYWPVGPFSLERVEKAIRIASEGPESERLGQWTTDHQTAEEIAAEEAEEHRQEIADLESDYNRTR